MAMPMVAGTRVGTTNRMRAANSGRPHANGDGSESVENEDDMGLSALETIKGRKRGRTKIFFSVASKDENPGDYVEDEYGEEDHESVNQRLEFRERHQVPDGYDYRGALTRARARAAPACRPLEQSLPESFADRRFLRAHRTAAGTLIYTVFLAFFLYHTLHGRTHAYYFTQYARDVADVDKFMEIDDPIKYRDWLEYRFLPGMHWNGVDRSTGGTPSIIVVGPPRVRAVRAKEVRPLPLPTSAGCAGTYCWPRAGVRWEVEARSLKAGPPNELWPCRRDGRNACCLL